MSTGTLIVVAATGACVIGRQFAEDQLRAKRLIVSPTYRPPRRQAAGGT